MPDSVSDNQLLQSLVNKFPVNGFAENNDDLWINGQNSQCIYSRNKCSQLERELKLCEKLTEQMDKRLQDQEKLTFLLKNQIMSSNIVQIPSTNYPTNDKKCLSGNSYSE